MRTGAHSLSDLGAEAESLLMTGNRVMGKHQGGEFLKPNALGSPPVEINGKCSVQFFCTSEFKGS